ncbi:MAG: DNA repair protein [Gammaproteobacteria bacterium MedPE]|nr:MAG: DNA repair protein [Gammaproteobacteria bacterium MedPE]
MKRNFLFALTLVALVGCQSAYYGAMEKVGIHKRDILVDRVEDTRDAQNEAQQQFNSALEELSALINFNGGELETIYNNLNDQYAASTEAKELVSKRIDNVESVAQALFSEWEDEINQYSNATFKRNSSKQLNDTKRLYARMLRSMHQSEKKMDPVLAALNDNVLYLKHNLNANAVNAIEVEFKQLKQEIAVLIKEVNQSIAESNKFIETLSK